MYFSREKVIYDQELDALFTKIMIINSKRIQPSSSFSLPCKNLSFGKLMSPK